MDLELNALPKLDRCQVIEAALDLSRLHTSMRMACTLVLAFDYRNTDAARLAGVERRNLATALCNLRPHLALVVEDYKHAMGRPA